MRRFSLRLIPLVCPAVAAVFGLPADARAGEPAANKTNFLVILCDDLGYGDLACYGHPTIRTPNLDRLAGEGLRLTDYYAPAPVCSPSRAGMLTGRTPNRCGIYDWIPGGSPMHLRRREITIATLLKQAGYATGFFGKWHCNGKFNSPAQPQPGDHGFDWWFATQNNAGPTHKNPVNFVENGRPVGPLEGYSSTLIVERATDWLKKQDRERPFCLFVWFHSPHEIIATADEFVAQYPDATPKERAIYYGNVTQTDHEIGRLLKTVDELGLRDNTLVMFTSDNGPETLNRYPNGSRCYGSPGPFRGMKLHLYEGGIREPCIIRWPGRARPGQVCAEPICGTDLLPTFCEIAGVPQPKDRAIDGTSFLPVFEGKPLSRKTPLYWQYDSALGDFTVAVRQGDWKIFADRDLKTFELYNLKDDPSERTNLAPSQARRVARMSATLRKLHKDIRREGPKWPATRPKQPPAAREAKNLN